jgi:predicted nucleic acid-binding protein
MVCYLDSGVFVTPMLKNRSLVVVEECLEWLEKMRRGQIQGVTSWMSWDEVTYVAGRGAADRSYDSERAAAAGDLLCALPNLRFTPVDEDVVNEAQSFLRRTKARPRDSIHASSAVIHATGNLVTLDSDFAREGASSFGLNVILVAES